MWLGQKGALTDNGLGPMLERAAQAGIGRIHAHQLRHTAADMWLAESGGDETSAMRLFGWRSRQMLQRYAASNADSRAHAAARKLGIGDRLQTQTLNRRPAPRGVETTCPRWPCLLELALSGRLLRCSGRVAGRECH